MRVLTNSLARLVTIRGRSGARCYMCLACDTYVALPLHCACCCSLDSDDSRERTPQCGRIATKCTRHFTACMRLLHCSMRPHATKCTRHFMACMRLAAALQHAAAALRHAFVACEVNSIARAHSAANGEQV